MEMIRVCFVCGKKFDTAPYYIREERTYKPVCSIPCLHQIGEKTITETEKSSL